MCYYLILFYFLNFALIRRFVCVLDYDEGKPGVGLGLGLVNTIYLLSISSISQAILHNDGTVKRHYLRYWVQRTREKLHERQLEVGISVRFY